MNESEQAQAIAEIRKRHLSIQEGIELGTMRIGMPTAIVGHNDRAALLEIVDSQAQKIKEQAKEIEMLRNVTNAIEFGTYKELEIRLHMEKLADFDAARLKR